MPVAPPARGGSASGGKPKSDYHLKKERESEKRKTAAKLRKLEEEIAALKKEREAIHESFASGHENWSRERNDRYEELARLIEAAEARWLELTQILEKLSARAV